jgi:diadenosine tetraphosphatase ApaH/serine/threonine PP2A family protein phosphatase
MVNDKFVLLCFSAMRYAIVADIHANASALKAVLSDIERRGGAEELLCLGDITGYGPDPHECIELLRCSRAVSISGNHDLAAMEKLSLSYFSPDAARAARWTAARLDGGDRAYLESLPPVLVHGGFTLVHGSPRQPAWEYLISSGSARQNFTRFSTACCLVGHTHMPLAFKLTGDGVSFIRLSESVGLALENGRFIINPGSVGQPRDGDPRASYALYETESKILRLRRVSYDIDAVQERFFRAGLPLRLASRLGQGI